MTLFFFYISFRYSCTLKLCVLETLHVGMFVSQSYNKLDGDKSELLSVA